MNEQTCTLLNEVAKNAEMGKNTIRQLLGIAEDERLKEHLHRQLRTQERRVSKEIGLSCRSRLAQYH